MEQSQVLSDLNAPPWAEEPRQRLTVGVPEPAPSDHPVGYATVVHVGQHSRLSPERVVVHRPCDVNDDLFAQGLIELAGPLADGSGAMSVVRSDSVDEVRGWFEADPWTVHDVLPVRDVQEWTIFLDGRTTPNP